MPGGLGIGAGVDSPRQAEELTGDLLETVRKILAADPDTHAAWAFLEDLQHAQARGAAARVALEAITRLIDAVAFVLGCASDADLRIADRCCPVASLAWCDVAE